MQKPSMRIQRIVLATSCSIVIAAFVGAIQLRAQPQPDCGTCRPNQHQNFEHVTEDMTVCFEGGNFSSTEIEAAVLGAQYWDNHFAATGLPAPRIAVNTDPEDGLGCTLMFRAQPDLPPTSLARAHGPSEAEFPQYDAHWVGFNPDILGDSRSPDFWRNLTAHELGHVLGFTEVAGVCAGYTAMAWDSNRAGLDLTQPLCGDLTAAQAKWVNNSGLLESEHSSTDATENGEVCDFHFRVEEVYMWVLGEWELVHVSVTLLYVDNCHVPSPEG